MLALLIALSLFNAAAAAASLGQGMRLFQAEERALWRSRLLWAVSVAMAWSLPLISLGATSFAWLGYLAGRIAEGLAVFAPLAWLIVMGVVFAVLDFAEDGVLGNARRREPRQPKP